MTEIECLSCYKVLDIPNFVDIDNYDGEIVCNKCRARLAIKFIGSPKPVKYRVVKEPPPLEPGDIVIKVVREDEKGNDDQE